MLPREWHQMHKLNADVSKSVTARRQWVNHECQERGGLRRVSKRQRLSANALDLQARPQVWEAVVDRVSAFAPATVANLGPGYDWLGCAVEGEGDTITAHRIDDRPGEVFIESIEGDGGKLDLNASKNCAGIAALETLKLLGNVNCGIGLKLVKGLPLGSGMGSSAASAAAAAWAVNCLFGAPLSKEELIMPGLISEATVSGYHADNIAPALLGGFVLVRSTKPLDVQQLVYPGELTFVLVNPKFEAPTKEMRAKVPKEVPMSSAVHNCSKGGSLVAGILMGDSEQVGKAMDSECIVEPARGPCIPGFQAVKTAARDAGAYGCTISGAGPTCVAIAPDEQTATHIADAMSEAFVKHGHLEVASARLSCLDKKGARVVNR